MKQIAWLLKWILKGAVFFTLFAFALNNQHEVTVHFFFGYRWNAPLVLVVVTVFAAGLFVGVLGMVPRWWRQRRAAAQARQQMATQTPSAPVENDKSLASVSPSTQTPYGV